MKTLEITEKNISDLAVAWFECTKIKKAIKRDKIIFDTQTKVNFSTSELDTGQPRNLKKTILLHDNLSEALRKKCKSAPLRFKNKLNFSNFRESHREDFRQWLENRSAIEKYFENNIELRDEIETLIDYKAKLIDHAPGFTYEIISKKGWAKSELINYFLFIVYTKNLFRESSSRAAISITWSKILFFIGTNTERHPKVNKKILKHINLLCLRYGIPEAEITPFLPGPLDFFESLGFPDESTLEDIVCNGSVDQKANLIGRLKSRYNELCKINPNSEMLNEPDANPKSKK